MQHRVREHRRKVVIRAKMRAGGPQVDVCIRDISSRGLMLQTSAPPPRGAYVEVVGAGQIIIGQVIWAKDRRFGVRARDPINLSAAIPGAGPATAHRPPAAAARPQAFPVARAADDSHRMLAKAMEFTVIGAVAAILVLLVASMAYETLRSPLDPIAKHLGRES